MKSLFLILIFHHLGLWSPLWAPLKASFQFEFLLLPYSLFFFFLSSFKTFEFILFISSHWQCPGLPALSPLPPPALVGGHREEVDWLSGLILRTHEAEATGELVHQDWTEEVADA